MSTQHSLSRRSLMTQLAAGAAGTLAAGRAALAADAPAAKPNGRIRQSFCRWCYGKMSLEELARHAVRFGYQSIELLTPQDWPVIKKYGLTCAIASGTGPLKISSCLNRIENHDACVAELKKNIELAAEAGVPSVICFSGNRKGMPDDEGLANCAVALKRVVGLAEKKKVNVCMELLNSKVNHKDYMFDRSAWGVELAKKVGSPRFGILYDIYHAQIMEGDVIRTIRTHHEHILHYHTGGNPGRHEIDHTQELNYPAIMKAILETGYTGYVGQEFIPVRDPVESLAQAFAICDV